MTEFPILNALIFAGLGVLVFIAAFSLASVDEIQVRFAQSMRSARPHTAASGYPFASALPNAARSGVTPESCWYPPVARRKPVFISSKTSAAPLASHRARARAIHSGDAMRSTTGSSTIAASRSPASPTARSSAGMSSNGTARKSRFTPSGTPGDDEHQSCHPK